MHGGTLYAAKIRFLSNRDIMFKTFWFNLAFEVKTIWTASLLDLYIVTLYNMNK